MDRRQLLAALLALGVQPVLRAQNKGSTIALLWIEPERPSPFIAALVQGLREHGYTPGRNIRVDERYLVAGYTELQGAAERLVREKPDIIVTFGGTALQAARKATNSVPIVMVSGGDPVKLGIVKSLSRPGGNVTGLVTLTSDLSGKRLELLKEGFPGIKRIAVALSPLSETELTELKNYERAARNLNLDLYVAEIRTADDIAPTIAGLQSKGVEAITFVGSSLFIANRARIAAAVAKTRLPAIYTNEMFTEAGGLLSYGTSVLENFRRAGGYIDKIVRGANPADLPIEQPTRLQLVINSRTAKTQALDIPRAIQLRADRIID